MIKHSAIRAYTEKYEQKDNTLPVRIRAMAVNNPEVQYAVVRGHCNFSTLGAIYRAGLDCTKKGIECIRVKNKPMARHYGNMASAFFAMFDKLTAHLR